MSKASTNGKSTIVPTTAEERRVYATHAEAVANKPAARSSWRLFSISGLDKQQFCWARNPAMACMWLVQNLGYTVEATEQEPRERVASLLAQLTAEDRNALLAQYLSTKKGK
jgi:hypothetical protein